MKQTARFGKTTLKANVYLPEQQLKIYTVLRAYQGNEKTCFPSLADIREDLSYFDEERGEIIKKYLYSIGYISKIIGKLRADGWVVLVRKGGYGRANEYQVLDCSPQILRFETQYSFPQVAKVENYGFPSREAKSSFPSMKEKHKQDPIQEAVQDHGNQSFIVEKKKEPEKPWVFRSRFDEPELELAHA